MRVGTRVKALEKDGDGCTRVAVLAPADGAADERLEFGMLVWSAGLQQTNFVRQLYSPQYEIRKSRTGRLLVDEHLRLQVNASDPDDDDVLDEAPEGDASEALLGGRVYAIGDCAVNDERPLPPTAQVAEQQADYLAASLNQGLLHGLDRADAVPLPQPVAPSSFPPIPPMFYKKSRGFQYINRGSMSSVGFGDGLVDMTKIDQPLPSGEPTAVRGPTITQPMSFRSLIVSDGSTSPRISCSRNCFSNMPRLRLFSHSTTSSVVHDCIFWSSSSVMGLVSRLGPASPISTGILTGGGLAQKCAQLIAPQLCERTQGV